MGNTIRLYHLNVATKKRRKLPFTQCIDDENEVEEELMCGNFSVRIDDFVAKLVPSKYMCVVCNKVPYIVPFESTCCNSIYCQECFLAWKAKSQTCFRANFDECDKQLRESDKVLISDHKKEIWGLLEVLCCSCRTNIRLQVRG